MLDFSFYSNHNQRSHPFSFCNGSDQFSVSILGRWRWTITHIAARLQVETFDFYCIVLRGISVMNYLFGSKKSLAMILSAKDEKKSKQKSMNLPKTTLSASIYLLAIRLWYGFGPLLRLTLSHLGWVLLVSCAFLQKWVQVHEIDVRCYVCLTCL